MLRRSRAAGVVAAVAAALLLSSVAPAQAIAPPVDLPSDPVSQAVRLEPAANGWLLSIDEGLVTARCAGTCRAYTQSFYVEGSEGPEQEDDPTYVEPMQGWRGPSSRDAYYPGAPNMPLADGVYSTTDGVDTGGPSAIYTHLRAVLSTADGVVYGEWVKAREPVPHQIPALTITKIDSNDIYASVGNSSLYMWNRECWATCRTAIWGYSPTWGSRALGSFVGVSGKVPHSGGYYGYTRLWAVLTSPDAELAPFTTAKIAMPTGTPMFKIEGGVDIAAAAALVTSRGVTAEEFCLPLNTVRVSPGEPTVTTAYTTCDTTARTVGTAEAIRQVARQFGAATVAVLLAAVQVQPVAPGQAPPRQPAPSPVDTPDRAPAWAGSPEESIQRIEDSLRRRANASRPIPESSIRYVATTCYETATKGNLTPSVCERLPIFLPGAEVWTAAAHDAEAILARPDRLMLHRGPRIDRWYDSTPPCRTGTYDPDVETCDEYPFAATKEAADIQATAGAQGTAPDASLKLVVPWHNQYEGSLLSGFHSNCRVPKDAGAFLVIPLIPPGTGEAPPLGALPTSRVCAP